MEESTGQSRYWTVFAFVTVSLILTAALFWALSHPFGIHWDEAEYINQSLVDTHRLQHGALYKLAGRILKSGVRPPAYRVLALPFFVVFGFHTILARVVTLAWFALSSWFLFLATRRIAGPVAGALAVLVFCLSPEVIAASAFYSTEGPLYLATSAMFYFLFACWTETSDSARNWIGLGLAAGIGFVAKASFIAVALPLIPFWIVECRRKLLPAASLMSLLKAGCLAAVIAGPWWLLNLRLAIAGTRMAREFSRDSLGPPSLLTWMRWLNTVTQSLLGLGVSLVIALILIAAIRKVLIKKQRILDPLQGVALGACVCAGLPLVLAQLSGTNHLLRHISPAVIPLAIAVGVLAAQAGWASSRGAVAASTALMCAQLLLIVGPVVFPNRHLVESGFVNGDLPWRVLARLDQWDWRPVLAISDSCGVAAPRISYLGGGRAFNKPQIEFPWMAKPSSTGSVAIDTPDVKRLWHFEEGPLDWQKVMDEAAQSDLVLTAPGYVGELDNKEDEDNQYDAEFAARLSRDPRFRGPIRLQMGRFEPVQVAVFLNNTLRCPSGLASTAVR